MQTKEIKFTKVKNQNIMSQIKQAEMANNQASRAMWSKSSIFISTLILMSLLLVSPTLANDAIGAEMASAEAISRANKEGAGVNSIANIDDARVNSVANNIVVGKPTMNVIIGRDIVEELVNDSETGRIHLSYGNARDRAYLNSDKLRDAERTVEKTLELRDRMAFFMPQSVPPAEPGYTGSHEAVYTMHNNFLAIDANWQMAKQQYEIEKESINYQTLKLYNAVIKSRVDYADAQSALALAEQEYAIVKLKSEYDMASSYDLKNSDLSVQSAREALESKGKSLASAEYDLEKYIGIKDISDYQLDSPASYQSMADREIDINLITNRIRTGAPTILIFEKQEYLAQQAVDTFNVNANIMETIKVKELELEQAQANLANHRKQLVEGAQSIYLGIQGLESGYAEILLAEQTIELGYVNLAVMVEQGLSPKIELLRLEDQLRNLQNQKLGLEIQHQELIHTLYKPWVMQGGQ